MPEAGDRRAPGSGPADRVVGSASFAVLLGFALVAAVLLSHNPADLDVWARMAVGQLVEATGDVPRVDPFAFTPRKDAWIDHEWLSGVAFDGVARLGGGTALFGAKLLLVAATIALLVAARVARSTASSARLAVLLPALAWSVDAWVNTVRSHVFTLLLLALFAAALARFERSGRARWLVPLVPAAWVWAQLHGGVLVGLGMLGVTAAWSAVRSRERARPLALAAAACVAAVFVGPYGPGYVRFLLEAVTMDRPGIREWEPLALGTGDALVPAAFTVLLLAGALADPAARRRAGPGLVLLALAAVFAFRHQRHVPVYLLLAYVYGADLIAAPFVSAARTLRLPTTVLRRGAAAAAVLAAVLLVAFGGARLAAGAAVPTVSWYPVDACRWLAREGPGGRLLVGFNEGSYALWRLWPRYLVSLDGRYEEVYPESTKALVVDALDPTAPRHAAALAGVAPDAILARRDELETLFGAGWTVAYRDARFDVLVPGDSPSAPAGPADVPGAGEDVWVPPPWR